MKKKIVSYLILACAVFGMAMVGSCKDYDDYADLRATNKIDHQEFRDSLAIHRIDIDSIFKILEGICKYNCDSLGQEVYKLDSAITKWLLGGMVGDSVNDWIVLDSTFNDSNDIAGVLRFLNQRVNDVRHDLDSIADTLTKKDSILAATDAILTLQIQQLRHDLDSIADTLNKRDSILFVHDSILFVNDSVLDSRVDTLDSIVYYLDSIVSCYIDTIDSISDIVARLKKCVDDTIQPKLKLLEDRIDTLNLRVDSLMDAEKRRITSLYIQGTENPSFGTFALPFGVRSNVLMAYHGKVRGTVSGTGIKFPTGKTDRMWFKEQGFSDREKELIAASGFTLDADGISLTSDEEIFGDSIGNAGKLYFTVNPNEVEIDSTYSFSLVNSIGDTVKVALDSIKISPKKLTFGYATRAAGSTGFYEASVTIAKSDAESLRPNIDRDALVNIAKDLKHNRDITLTGISTAVLKTLDGVLDANALNVAWTDSMGDHSVTSGYDLAVATVTPLSYRTIPALMDTFSITKRRLPVNPVDEVLSSISTPSVNLTFTPITMGTVTFKIDTVKYSSTIGLSDVVVNVEIFTDPTDPSTKIGEGSTTVSMTDSNNKIEAEIGKVIKTINGTLVGVQDSVKKLVNNIQSQIQDQVNDMLTSVEGQLENEVTNMFTSIKTQIGSNKFISRINGLASKFNKVLDNVNELLEVSLLYEGADGAFHPMSGTRTIPSIFKSSGGSTIELYPTSLTGEILAPAYKKFIAVTNVIDPSNGQNAKDDAGTYENVLKTVNQQSTNFVSVIDGSTSVTFKPTAGYIYEIAYSAIDYQGFISTRRFYVHVQ